MADRPTCERHGRAALSSLHLGAGSDDPRDNPQRSDYVATMTETDTIFERFKDELGGFLLKVQTTRVLDAEAFERLNADSRKLAQELKNQPLVPKSVLNEMRVATKILRAEAVYMRDEQDVMLDMANKLEMTFDLILLGEDHSDRSPGVPRII